MKILNFYSAALLFFIIFLCSKNIQAQTNPNQPNILLIIADDLGVDYTNGYHNSPILPVTPNLDALQTQGITFDNAWAAPQCTPTRAAIMSGKHGIKTGATEVPAQLDPNTHISIFRELATQTNNAYADALIGKWHIAPLNNYNGPTNHGVDYFAGRYGGGVQDYYNWGKVENGVESTVTNYATNEFTDDAIDWIANRNSSWFLWLAHTAPHSPYHTPPDSMYTTGGGGGNLHQGSIHVPLIVAGKGVSRIGEREDALVNVTDIYATILEAAGADLPSGMYNSLIFNHLLDNSPGDERPYNYMEYTATSRAGWTIVASLIRPHQVSTAKSFIKVCGRLGN